MKREPGGDGALPGGPAPGRGADTAGALTEQSARMLRQLHPAIAADIVPIAPLGAGAVPRVRLALERRARMALVRRRLARGGALAAAVALASTSALIIGRRGSVGPELRREDTSALVVTETKQLGSAASGTVRTADGERSAPALGMALATGSRVMAPGASELSMGTPDGTSLTLEAGGALTIVQQDSTRRFSLATGAVRARVAKLAPGQRFLITTADAEVEVHGTEFRVATADADPTCGGGSHTRVSVVEGVVSVRTAAGEIRVPAGGRWPTDCAPSAATGGGTAQAPAPSTVSPGASAARLSGAAPARPRRKVPPRSVATDSANATTTSPTSSGALTTTTARPQAPIAASGQEALAVQNDLLLGAMRAKRQGRPREAVQQLAELITRYPAGPLLEAAMAERMRTLGTLDRVGAAAAAEGYLMRFPRGFARDEARRLTVDP